MKNNQINHYRTRFERYLEYAIADANIRAPRIREAIHYALFPGGKRLRPMLVYLTGEVLNVSLDTLDVIASALEITHCYSLIHDDLPAMDNDDFRRGKPSCHKAFDEATAILAGDGMQAMAIDLLLTALPKDISVEAKNAITHLLVRAIGPAGMVSGQSLDLTELQHKRVTAEELTDIHQLKTGKLIAACIDMVLAVASPSSVITDALQSFASHLGLVFQMQDDYLDCYQPHQLGKARASDKINQKITFADLYSQQTLLATITHYYQQALLALAPLGSKAKGLESLIISLQQVLIKIPAEQKIVLDSPE